ncbi:MAG: ribosome silencing factor [Anaerolineales bacterium]|nr:ribosome silencing factor [Anaerolineales bacterium]
MVDTLEEKKGENILLMDIRGLAPFADFFVLCSGSSDRMLQALADAALEGVKSAFQVRGRIEGAPREGWILVDFGDVILHLLSPDRREYYRLEELWSKGQVLLHLQ